MQRNAMERLNLHQLLMEPELLQNVEADVHLVANLLALQSVKPAKTMETARTVVRNVVEELPRKLRNPVHQSVGSSLDRAARYRLAADDPGQPQALPARIQNGHPRTAYRVRPQALGLAQCGALCGPERLDGRIGRLRRHLGAVLASLPSLKTHIVVFDTAVVDLTDQLDDPAELLFGRQWGGGTDIARALTNCQGLIRQPEDTILVLISDLYEGGNVEDLHKRSARLVGASVQIVVLLTLNDEGIPAYDNNVAAALAEFGVPAFAGTPDHFPDLMAAAINRSGLTQWAAGEDIAIAHPVGRA